MFFIFIWFKIIRMLLFGLNITMIMRHIPEGKNKQIFKVKLIINNDLRVLK